MHSKKNSAVAACLLLAVTLASAQTIYLYNGSFSQCMDPCPAEYGSPANWGIEGMPTTMGVWRNTEEYHSAPAGLTVMSVGEEGGHFTQGLVNIPTPGSSFTYDFWVNVESRTDGNFQIVVHFAKDPFWTECSPSGWRTLYLGNSTTSGWVNITGSTGAPSDATKAIFRIWLSGGTVTFHVDDIKINGQEEVVSVEPIAIREAARVPQVDVAPLRIYTPRGQLVGRSDVRALPVGAYVVGGDRSMITRIMGINAER